MHLRIVIGASSIASVSRIGIRRSSPRRRASRHKLYVDGCTRKPISLPPRGFCSFLGAAENKTISEKHPAGGNYNIPLWDEGKVPLSKGDGPLDKPFLTVFQPPEGKRNGAAVVVAPGGSNIMLMYGGEGADIAERYNDWGVTAFILSYRLSPRYGQDARVLDAKRAVQVVRSRVAEFKIDPKRVGYIEFLMTGSSLGRNLADAAGPGDPERRRSDGPC